MNVIGEKKNFCFFFLQEVCHYNGQRVFAWGWFSWLFGPGPRNCDSLTELTVKQIACSDRTILILTESGKVYYMYYTSETQSPQLIECKYLVSNLSRCA